MNPWGLAQAAAETKRWDALKGRYGPTSFKQGHRFGFTDGVEWAGPTWLTLTDPERDDHRQECRWGCIFDRDQRLWATCVSCQAETEAVGPDELSTCCGSDTYLGES